MPKGRTIAWLVMMWLIASFAGFNLAYALNNQLVILAVLGLVLSLAALAGSLLPLAYGLGLWEESRAEEAPPFAFSPSPSAPAEPPPVAPAYQEGSRAIVHEAGPPVGERQTCVRCALVLCDFSNSSAAPPRALPTGAWVAETQDFFYHLDSSRPLRAEESFCTEPVPQSEWEALRSRPARGSLEAAGQDRWVR